MSNGIGRQELDQTIGRSVSACVNPTTLIQKVAGVTFDWSTVTALGADTEFADGVKVKAGKKVLRYGTFISKITATNKYGLFSSAAVDGREVKQRGRVYWLNKTVTEDDEMSEFLQGGEVSEGGHVATSRMLFGGANQLTRAEVEALFPFLFFVGD